MPEPNSVGRGAVCAVLLAGLGIARILAQAPAQQPTGSMSGRVLDGSTGEPVVGAQVMLDPTGTVGVSGSGARIDTRTGRTVMTDARGEFTFGELTPGPHRIEASKAGYRNGFVGGMTAMTGFGEALPIAANERRTGIVMRMWRTAAISGKVKLASGGPLVRMTVAAIRATSVCGVDRLIFGTTTTTDDTGGYRFFDLAPGDYVISTAPVRGSTLASGPYPTTYFPGVIDPAAARSVSLAGGDERVDVDILVPNSGYSVNGRVVSSDGVAASGKRGVDLWPASPTPVVDRPVARIFTDPDGRFQFQNVPSGRYVTRVVEFPAAPNGGITQMGSSGFTMRSSNRDNPLPPVSDAATWWGESRIDVTDRDVDTTVRLQEGWRIQGRVTFEGIKEAPSPASREHMPVLATRSDGSSPGGFGVSYQSGRVEMDGRFTTVALPPGRYALSIMLALPSPTPSPTDWSLQAIRLGGRDVTTSSIELNGGSVSDVTVAFTDRAPSISGTVEGGADLGTFGARVHVFPTDEQSWSDCGTTGFPRLRYVAVGSDGRFDTGRLPPGEYYVAATIGAEDNWITTPYLRSLVPFAVRVRVELGDKSSVQLKARPRK